jgi:outer membrane protein OmpA-like peptidoglycan-associated protein
MRALAYLVRELEGGALRESAERRFARTNPGGVIEGTDSLELNNYLVDSPTPRPEHVSAIRRMALRLAQGAFTDTTFALEIVGHASSSGGRAQNLGLSRERARQAAEVFFAAVRADLLARGIALPRVELALGQLRNRTHIRGVGINQPAVSPAPTAADLARNRRVEIFVTAQG